jgi:hypothetical protein
MRLFSQGTKVEALKRAPLFEGLSRKELTQLARVSEDMEIPDGTALCKEGEIGRVLRDRRRGGRDHPERAQGGHARRR